jgi:hypothetical protein
MPVVEPEGETSNTRRETKADQAKADADRKVWREEMAAMRKEMEARLDEEKPTSVDREPEAAAEEEVPEENATVMPVGEPKKRRRDRRLAAERRRHKQKNSTRKNGAPQNELAVACRKMLRRATVARRMRDIFRHNTTHRATVARLRKDTLAPNMTRRAKVARHKENTVKRNGIRNNVARKTLKGRRLQVEPEGSIGVNDEETRRRLHPGNERTASRTLGKTLELDIRQRAVEIPSGLENIKNWTLWRGRPLPKRKK